MVHHGHASVRGRGRGASTSESLSRGPCLRWRARPTASLKPACNESPATCRRSADFCLVVRTFTTSCWCHGRFVSRCTSRICREHVHSVCMAPATSCGSFFHLLSKQKTCSWSSPMRTLTTLRPPSPPPTPFIISPPLPPCAQQFHQPRHHCCVPDVLFSPAGEPVPHHHPGRGDGAGPALVACAFPASEVRSRRWDWE